MRAFVAVRIPVTPEIDAVLKSLATMQPAVRSVTPDQLHVTLKFLGETEEARVPELSAVVQDVVGRECRGRVRLKGLGVFPRMDRPNVVWVGLSDAELLNRLAAEFESRFAALGFAREARPFAPHLTLARVKFRPPATLAEFVRDNINVDFGSTDVGVVELMRSDLHPGRREVLDADVGRAPFFTLRRFLGCHLMRAKSFGNFVLSDFSESTISLAAQQVDGCVLLPAALSSRKITS